MATFRTDFGFVSGQVVAAGSTGRVVEFIDQATNFCPDVRVKIFFSKKPDNQESERHHAEGNESPHAAESEDAKRNHGHRVHKSCCDRGNPRSGTVREVYAFHCMQN